MVNPSKWANLKSNFLKFHHRNQVILGIEKARKMAYFRAFLALLSCRLSLAELRSATSGFEAGINTMLNAFNIHAETGSVSILVGGSLAMAQLKEIAATIAPPLVVGSYILASSGFPLQVIFGQIPAIWSGCTDLTEREAMTAAIIGAVIKVLTAALFATCLQFLYM